MRTYPHTIKVGGINLTINEPTDETDEEIITKFLSDMGVEDAEVEAKRLIKGVSNEEMSQQFSSLAFEISEMAIQRVLAMGGSPSDLVTLLELVSGSLLTFIFQHTSGKLKTSSDELVDELAKRVKSLVHMALESSAGHA